MVTQVKSQTIAETKSAAERPIASEPQLKPRQAYGTGQIMRAAVIDSFRKLDPRVQLRNPVMFVVFVGSLFTTGIGIGAVTGLVEGAGRPSFVLAIAAWLWLTVLF